jgi:hypothetical protein
MGTIITAEEEQRRRSSVLKSRSGSSHSIRGPQQRCLVEKGMFYCGKDYYHLQKYGRTLFSTAP